MSEGEAEGRRLIVTVRFADARYHGAGDWPPAPARLFQALVAAAARGRRLGEEDAAALTWLEGLAPPTIAAASAREGQAVGLYVPNNDLDAFGGDVRRVPETRVLKNVRPWLLSGDARVVYAWAMPAAEGDGGGGDADAASAARVGHIAAQLYQLGRGVDMAWAEAEVLDERAWEARAAGLAAEGATLHRPRAGEGERELLCPERGSLASLRARYEAFTRRFERVAEGKKLVTWFRQPPKPRFASVGYEGAPVRTIWALVAAADATGAAADGASDVDGAGVDGSPAAAAATFAPWPLARAHGLVTALRDGVHARLAAALPMQAGALERVIIGRGEGARARDRVRFVPLPSTGHAEVDPAIRRVLVEVPRGGVVAPEDVAWAVSEAVLAGGRVVVPAEEDGQGAFYGLERTARRWRSVTAAALPEHAARRRIAPERRGAGDEAKGGAERAREVAEATRAVVQALRHAGVPARAAKIRVQREPFDKRGERAEAFAADTRFAKERLWHIEVELERAVAGPMVLGDGRFLGLGVMRALRDADGVAAFAVVGGLAPEVDARAVAAALRRAVMARAGEVLGARGRGGGGARGLPRLFSGHEADGTRAQGEHDHLCFVCDAARGRLLVVAPWAVGRGGRGADGGREAQTLAAALEGLVEVRAGASGVLAVARIAVDLEADALTRAARVWRSLTPYQVTRHAKAGSAGGAVALDVLAECQRARLPRPEVEVAEARGWRGVGLEAEVRLRFATAVEGPLLLGRSRHEGGGVFVAE